EDGNRVDRVTGVQTCALPIFDAQTERRLQQQAVSRAATLPAEERRVALGPVEDLPERGDGALGGSRRGVGGEPHHLVLVLAGAQIGRAACGEGGGVVEQCETE